MGANDAADLAGQGLGTVQIILQVGLDGGHLAGGDGVACQRGQRGVDAAKLFDLFEEGNIGAGQAPGLASQSYFAPL